ncbi:hypothetical protein [Rubellicoccus peritrichatus]|uniref:Core-binding (CB) domain-containing protein n=1 Tax=Rubellicoccus peritrichatus TaxID=3080537 RepID=A0AAQ3QTV9_9BACT|nr:hypothetical protein [Puniceicoccus sp. CR14]WOO39360.1 hypothetical protein RZN69_12110 [Puniceicoccus sp. CR14]
MKANPIKIEPFKYPSGNKGYLVIGTIDGIRYRKKFKSRDEARAEKATLELQRVNASRDLQSVTTTLTADEVRQCEVVLRRLRQSSHSQIPLDFAVDFFIKNYREPKTSHTLETAIPLFIQYKREHVGKKQLNDLNGVLTRFSEANPTLLIHELNESHLISWLESLNISKKSWNNYQAIFSSFFSWTLEKPRQWISENPASHVKRHRNISGGIPDVLTLEEAQNLMEGVESYQDGRWSLYAALGLFAGLRAGMDESELTRMGHATNQKELIDLENSVIRVTPEIAKTHDFRTIPIHDNLAFWIRRHWEPGHQIVPTTSRGQHTKFANAFGLKKNVMRHSFISFRVAECQSVGTTALEAGNTERIVKKHYLNMRTEQDAQSFWSIYPKGAASLVKSKDDCERIVKFRKIG